MDSGISSFAAAEHYLLGTIDETTSPRTSYKLDRMRALLHELGDPHLAYPTVHVGGTSGKGSTSTMIARALEENGKNTGLHTKPHLRDATERALVNGVAVSRDRFAQLLDGMMPAIRRVTAAYRRPTYYETLLALAFLHFQCERVDVAVIEVGLGGRLDGTNLVRPRVSAITSVGYDHTEVLGDTLEQIAREKGGIAKNGVPFVVADVADGAMRVLEECSANAGARLVRVADAVNVESASPDSRRFRAVTATARYDAHLGVRGDFQRTNAATAVAVLEALGDDLRPPAQAVERAFASVRIPGRFEILNDDPPLVLDIAHNPEKARALVLALQRAFPATDVHYVIAIGERKDAAQLLSIFGEMPGTFTFASFDVRGRPAIAPSRLRAMAQALDRTGSVAGDPVSGVLQARALAKPGEPIVVTGSTFAVAAVREWQLSEGSREPSV
jgi:dihydrofolate synthase/folylpolyglutamate synthase